LVAFLIHRHVSTLHASNAKSGTTHTEAARAPDFGALRTELTRAAHCDKKARVSPGFFEGWSVFS
jgi:hypothetical protein